MNPEVQALLDRLSDQPTEADRFFSDPAGYLSGERLQDADKEALLSLDRDALNYLSVADSIEPEIAPEHPSNTGKRAWVTIAIGLWGCVAYVLLWLLKGGTL